MAWIELRHSSMFYPPVRSLGLSQYILLFPFPLSFLPLRLPSKAPMRTWSNLARFITLGALCAWSQGRPSLANAGDGAPLARRAPATEKSVIIQMFEWTWDSVAAECTNFIGPAGYGFVQGMSPDMCRYYSIGA